MNDKLDIDTINNGSTPSVDEFLAMQEKVSNLWWYLSSGHHENLFEQAVEERDAARAEVRQLRQALARADGICNDWMQRYGAAVEHERAALGRLAAVEKVRDRWQQAGYNPVSPIAEIDAALGADVTPTPQDDEALAAEAERRVADDDGRRYTLDEVSSALDWLNSPGDDETVGEFRAKSVTSTPEAATDAQQCPNCEGRGRIDADQRSCLTCFGRGIVVAPSELQPVGLRDLTNLDTVTPTELQRATEQQPCNRTEPHDNHQWGHPGDLKLCPGTATPADQPEHSCCACFTHNNLPCCNDGHPVDDLGIQIRPAPADQGEKP